MRVFPYNRVSVDVTALLPKTGGCDASENGWMIAEKINQSISKIFYSWPVEEKNIVGNLISGWAQIRPIDESQQV